MRRILIVVQNLPVPLDRRVWLECQALTSAGYGVSVICPKGPGDPSFEVLDGVRIHKYPPPPAAKGLFAYLYEFVYCWLWTAYLALREYRRVGFDVLQACNPPDTYFALAALFRPTGVKFVFDHHDLCPEIFTARFGLANGPVVLAANRGRYDIDAQKIAIVGPLAVVGPEDYRLRTSDVLVDMKGRQLQSRGRVSGSMRLGSFEAGRLSADLGERTVTLDGGVRLKIVQGAVR